MIYLFIIQLQIYHINYFVYVPCSLNFQLNLIHGLKLTGEILLHNSRADLHIRVTHMTRNFELLRRVQAKHKSHRSKFNDIPSARIMNHFAASGSGAGAT